MKKNILLLLSLFFVVFSSVGQNNSRIILLDKKTGQSIDQANTHWQVLDDAKQQGYAVADYKGIIEIPKQPGTKIIFTASCIGYRAVKDTLTLALEQTLYVEEDVLNLEQVTITGTRTPHLLKKAPILTQLVTEKDLRQVDAPTITDVLQIEMPGVEMSNHGGVPVMNAMGLETQYSLVLVDGERLAKSLQKTIDYSRINTADIQQIEIIRGASSALYGSDALGGVINIITKSAQKKISVSADLRYMQANKKDHTQADIDDVEDNYAKQFFKNIDKPNLNGNLSVGIKQNNFSSSTFFNFKSVDAYRLKNTEGTIRYYKNSNKVLQPINNYETKINGFQDFTINQKLGYKLKKWDFLVRGSYYNHHEYDFSNDASHPFYDSYTGNAKVSYSLSDNDFFYLSHNFDLYQRANYNEKNGEKFTNHANKYNTTKLNYTKTMDKHKLFVEIENLYQTLTTDKFTYGKYISKGSNNSVLVIQDEFEWTKDWTIVGGIRVGYHSAYKMHASPSLTVKYNFKKLNFRASYARGFRSPDLKELYMNWDHLGMFQIIGNDGLKPETNNYYSFSIDFIEPAYNLNATLISSYNQVRDKIDGVWANNETEFRYVNFSSAKIFSLEALVRWQFHKNFKLKAGYIFLDSRKSMDAQNLSTMSPMSITAQLEYILTKGKYQLTANISGKVTGQKKFDVLDSEKGSIYEGQYYQVKYPIFSIWNLSINQYYGKHFKLGAGVKNLFDYKAPIVTFNTTNNPGRKFYVSLGYNF